jgi:hypothetical protein
MPLILMDIQLLSGIFLLLLLLGQTKSMRNEEDPPIIDLNTDDENGVSPSSTGAIQNVSIVISNCIVLIFQDTGLPEPASLGSDHVLMADTSNPIMNTAVANADNSNRGKAPLQTTDQGHFEHQQHGVSDHDGQGYIHFIS